MKNFETLAQLVESAKEDAQKFFTKGNKAAGTRLRAAMQQIKTLAQEVRKEVSNIKNSEKEQ